MIELDRTTMKFLRFSSAVFGLLLLFTSGSFAQLPNNLICPNGMGGALAFNNAQVLQWKKTTSDQYHDRALVQGKVTKVYPDHTGHTHFAIDLNGDTSGDLEVIYNDEFGALPRIQVGLMVIACGDYITVGPQARLPSPNGAIIHWVHYNPGTRDGGRHPHGFVVIGGKPYGYPIRN
jgi:hypothetical protein